MYSDMIDVQFNYVYQTLIGVNVSFIIVRQESLGNVVDLFHEGYNDKLLFFD